MDENEELYRLMNEDDDFYMGNKDDDKEDDEKKTSNIGCAGMLFLCCLFVVYALVILKNSR